jgi:serine/threonine protein phosphatase 1
MAASVWTIGDVHGEYEKLARLLEALPRTEEDYTVFVGDFIDRGPDSKSVVARVLKEYDAAPDRTILLWGNHEDMAAANFGWINTPSSFEYDPYDWFRNGGLQAMESYGLKPPEVFTSECPPDLWRLFGLLKTYWRAPKDRFPELENCIWVHAGILPAQQPEEANGDVLLWVREEFLNYIDLSGRLVIHGHTPFKTVRVLPDKIGIDTGAVFGGLLTALQMPERKLYQSDGRRVIETDLSEPPRLEDIT